MYRPIIEACVETVGQAKLARQYGADRIELCADLSVGGLTPPDSLLDHVQQAIDLPIMAMARPRGGNFTYTEEEVLAIKRAIDLFKRKKIKGVVFGFLTVDLEIDLVLTREMTAYAQPLEVTFHKAIDLTTDPVQSVHLLKKIPGIQRVLTSGGHNTAKEGCDNLKKMIAAAEGEISIIAAGSITKDNWEELHNSIGAPEYHGRRIVF